MKKPVSVNPLKMSQPLGGVLAFLGIKNCVPLMHGSQGCAAFVKMILTQHFREPIPVQNTAMSDLYTIMGGDENLHKGLLNVINNHNPAIVGILATAVTETQGVDMTGALTRFRSEYGSYSHVQVVPAATPDFQGSLETGFAIAVESILETVPQKGGSTVRNQITILPGSMLTPGDLEAVREMVEGFGMSCLMLPDLSGAMDGHLDEEFSTVTSGGISLEEIQTLAGSRAVIAIGESMRGCGERFAKRFKIPFYCMERLMGLEAVDSFFSLLKTISGKNIPEKHLRERRQLEDAMIDAQFHINGKRIALALESDLLTGVYWFLKGMGAEIVAAVSPYIKGKISVENICIGDFEELETLGRESQCIISSSHGKHAANEFKIPLMRMGFPVTDRMGIPQKVYVGYRGSRDFIFDIANLLIL